MSELFPLRFYKLPCLPCPREGVLMPGSLPHPLKPEPAIHNPLFCYSAVTYFILIFHFSLTAVHICRFLSFSQLDAEVSGKPQSCGHFWISSFKVKSRNARFCFSVLLLGCLWVYAFQLIAGRAGSLGQAQPYSTFWNIT